MKLFFDARYIRTDFHDGISRYTIELGTALAAITPVTFLISAKAQLALLPPHSHSILIHDTASPLEPLTAMILNKYHPDVVFSPMQIMGSTGRKFKLILTSHDMIYYRHSTPPRHLNMAIRLGWRAYHMTYIPERLALNAADIVATVSQTTKHEFQAAKLTSRPIIVIPNAPQKISELLEAPVQNSAPPRNLIYMGSFMPYKNVETLIRGMAFLPDHTLHLLSRIAPKRKHQLQQLVPQHAKVVFHSGVSDTEYARLLADNAALVTASLDEGYGLPIAEALALGVPAVVSDMAIFHEVAGEGAQYFPATSPELFAQAIKTLDDTKIRNAIITAGKKHIATFNWHDSARKLLASIHSLVS